MSLTINTNVSALSAQRNLDKTQMALAKSMSKLSSGLRINGAGDDAAGLAISESLRAQIRSLQQASRNASDGVSLLQTAEGGLNEVSGMLSRMRELAIQSANGTLTDSQRGSLMGEFNHLKAEIDRIGDATEFNGLKLLDGSLSAGVVFQIGLDNNAASQLTVNLVSAKANAIGSAATTARLDDQSISTATTAQGALSVIDDAINDISTIRGNLGAAMNRLTITIANLGTAAESLSAANSRIRDVDIAAETAELTRNQILSQAGVSVLSQANQMPQVALQLLKG
jgi:flagellin